jgi:hypothetical protein
VPESKVATDGDEEEHAGAATAVLLKELRSAGESVAGLQTWDASLYRMNG